MKKILVVLLSVLLLTSGCWNYRELNQLAIITAIGIDKADDGYKISVLIANGKNGQTNTQDGQSQPVVYTGKGKTISRAFKDIDLQIPKIPYIGHLGVVVISEEIAKEGTKGILDYLLRSPESVKKFYFIISKDNKAESILKVLSPLESFPGQSISTNISIAKEQEAISTSMTYSKFANDLLEKGIEPILPSISIKDDNKKSNKNQSLESSDVKGNIKLGPIGLLKKDKLIKFVSDDESRGINIITNQVDEMIIETKCKGGFAVIKLSSMKSKINISKNKKATINVKTNGEIQEITCDIDIENTKEIEMLEKESEKALKKKVKKAIDVTQKYEVDPFGFGNIYYKKYPKNYKTIKDWNYEYSNLKINYKIDITLDTKGSMKKII